MFYGYMGDAAGDLAAKEKAEIAKEEHQIKRMQFAMQVLLTAAVVGTFWISLHTYFKRTKKKK